VFYAASSIEHRRCSAVAALIASAASGSDTRPANPQLPKAPATCALRWNTPKAWLIEGLDLNPSDSHPWQHFGNDASGNPDDMDDLGAPGCIYAFGTG
jgi:hypothetical protein